MKNKTKKYINVLNNIEVKFESEVGECNFIFEGNEYCLYPVYKEWCDIEEQLSFI